jgi:hypothetical protein
MEKFIKCFGDFKNFNRSRVIHSVAVHASMKENKPDEVQYRVFNNEFKDLLPATSYLDQWAFHFLRNYTDISITSGEILRREKAPFEVPWEKYDMNKALYLKYKNAHDVCVLTKNPSYKMFTTNPFFTQDTLH